MWQEAGGIVSLVTAGDQVVLGGNIGSPVFPLLIKTSSGVQAFGVEPDVSTAYFYDSSTGFVGVTVNALSRQIDVTGTTGGAAAISAGTTTLTSPTGAVLTLQGGIPVAQSTHGFAVGDCIRFGSITGDPTNKWRKSQADSDDNSDVDGIVVGVVDANNFEYQLAGNIISIFTGLTAGVTYFLSPSTAGALTTTETTTVGEVTKPVLRALSATTAIFVGMRGAVIST